MLIPIRCFSCGKPISHLYKEYEELVKKENPLKVMEGLNVKRQCCRAIFLGTSNMMKTIGQYRKR